MGVKTQATGAIGLWRDRLKHSIKLEPRLSMSAFLLLLPLAGALSGVYSSDNRWKSGYFTMPL
jgi:hypothetical protein